MRRLPTLASLLGVAGVLAVLPFLLSAYHVSLVAKVGIFFIGVLGLNILTGYTGQISIGHGAFMAIGGYTTAVLSRDHNTNLVVTMLAAFALCFVFGVLVGLPALRFSGVYLAGSLFVLATNGFAAPDEFGVVLSLELLIGAAVAGLGSLWGILAGAAFVGLLPAVSTSVPVIGSEHGRDVVFGAAVIVVMLLLPDGFAGLLAGIRRRLARA